MTRREMLVKGVKALVGGLAAASLSPGCGGRGPTGPEDVGIFDYEIMYERVRPVVSTEWGDVDKGEASLVNWRGSGQSSTPFVKIEENKWVAMFYSVHNEVDAYHVFTCDERIFKLKLGDIAPAVAKNLYMRKRGEIKWTLLTCIEDCPLQVGEWAEVFLNNGVVHNP